MYEFLDRFITSTMPRIRDFNGISEKGFDGRGNYTMGIKEQIAFPEISIDKISNITGMDITFVTNTDSDDNALEVLKELGLPFKQNDDAEKARKIQIEKAKEEQRREAEDLAKSEASSDEDRVADEEKNVSDEPQSGAVEDNQDLSEESKKES